MTTRYSPVVRDALDHGYPVVAFETANITHAMPRPMNLDTVRTVQAEILASDVVPAAIATIHGETVIGLTDSELEGLISDPHPIRISVGDLPIVEARKLTGGVNLAVTIHLAHRAGIKVCATTGIGGVHRSSTSDNLIPESSDLVALSSHPLVLITSGVRPMLDAPATLGRLETLGIPVLGYRSSLFPSMYHADTGYRLSHQVDSEAEIADIARARDEMGLSQSLVVTNPIPPELELEDYQAAISEATEILSHLPSPKRAEETQVMVATFDEATNGQAQKINTELYRRNVYLAAQTAKQLATTPLYTD